MLAKHTYVVLWPCCVNLSGEDKKYLDYYIRVLEIFTCVADLGNHANFNMCTVETVGTIRTYWMDRLRTSICTWFEKSERDSRDRSPNLPDHHKLGNKHQATGTYLLKTKQKR